MKYTDFINLVPAQYTGKEMKATSSTELNDENKAKAFYMGAKQRLLHVNNWHHTAGIISAHFQLIDQNGKEAYRSVEKGDYIRVDIPGPGSSEGDGYDWVFVEELKEISNDDVESIGFRVKPSRNPFSNKNETAHFYSDKSSSNFIVTREQKNVSAVIIERNIKPNEESTSLVDEIRHASVSIGAIGLFSKMQWKSLTEGIVRQ